MDEDIFQTAAFGIDTDLLLAADALVGKANPFSFESVSLSGFLPWGG